MGVPVPPLELTGSGTVFMRRTQATTTEKRPPVLRLGAIPTPSPSIFVIEPLSIIVTTLTRVGSTGARKGCHDDAILELQIAEREGCQKDFRGTG